MSRFTVSSNDEQHADCRSAVSAEAPSPPTASGAEYPAAPAAAARPLWLPRWLTLELLLFALVVAFGAGLRLVGLGEPVLSAAEGERALAAWNAVHGREPDLWHGPTLVYGTGLVFFLFGANDLSARILPALAGTWLVAAPYFFRRYLGSGGAFAVAVILAFSPSSVFAARQVAGDAIALALVSLAVVCWLRYRQTDSGVYLALSGVAAGLALAAGPSAYALLLPLTLLLGAWRLLSRGNMHPAPDHAWRVAGLGAVVAVVVASTGLWSSPAGVQRGLIDAAAAWPAGRGVPWHFFATGPLLYETAALVFALLGLLLGGRRVARVAAALAMAWSGVLLYSLAGMGRLETLALVAAPLAVAGGLGLARTWEATVGRTGAAQAAFFLACAWPALGLFGTIMGYVVQPFPLIGPHFLLAPALYLGLVTSAWVYWRGPGVTIRGLGTLLMATALVGLVHTSSLLVFQTRPEAAEPLAREVLSRDLRALLAEVEDHSAVWSVPRRRDLAIVVAEPLRHPLAWYLRDYSRAVVGDLEGRPLLVIAPPDVKPPAGEYVYQRYTWQATVEAVPPAPGPFWRWLTYREPSGPVMRQEAYLYVAVPGRN